jgi:hypothetical protein
MKQAPLLRLNQCAGMAGHHQLLVGGDHPDREGVVACTDARAAGAIRGRVQHDPESG